MIRVLIARQVVVVYRVLISPLTKASGLPLICRLQKQKEKEGGFAHPCLALAMLASGVTLDDMMSSGHDMMWLTLKHRWLLFSTILGSAAWISVLYELGVGVRHASK